MIANLVGRVTQKASINPAHPKHPLLKRLRGVLVWGFAVMPIASCSLPGAGVDSAGDLKLFYAPFSLETPPPYWTVNQRPNSHRQSPEDTPLQWQDKDERIALALRPDLGTFEIGRRTNVIVLASPYLSFDWQFNSHAQPGDVELELGFRKQGQNSWTEGDLGLGKPSIDQLVRIPIGQRSVQYGQWQREYFDLSTLYRRYWPDTPNDQVRLVWIGVVPGRDHQPPVSGITYLTHILLSR
ncbi:MULTISPECIES: hypothetical protein [Thalassospira]|nr:MULTISPECIES: hypothetical protein [Thalassospira]MDG4721300.1 hypothetical protein [Thalassospira sp. FZY0004]